jgi:hypothetical protein
LLLKQDQAEAFQIVSDAYREHNPTSIGGQFGAGLVDIATKMALVNG